MNSVLQEIKDLERDRVQYNTKVDASWYDDYLQTFDKRVWIGQLQFAKIPTYGKNEYIGSIHINCDFSPKHKSKTFLHLTSLTGNTVVNRGKSSNIVQIKRGTKFPIKKG